MTIFTNRIKHLANLSRIIVVFGVVLAITSSKALAVTDRCAEYVAQGDTYLGNQELAQAEVCYRQAIRLTEKLPHNHDHLIEELNKLANILSLEYKTGPAEAAYRRSLYLVQNSYGKTSPKLLPILFSLGSLHEAAGDHSGAMIFYVRALGISEKDFSRYNPALSVASNVLCRQSKVPLAHALGLAQRERTSPPLQEQAGLDASRQLLQKKEGSPQDLIKGEDDSNNDLLADFQKEMSNKSVRIDPSDDVIKTYQQARVQTLSKRRSRKAGAS